MQLDMALKFVVITDRKRSGEILALNTPCLRSVFGGLGRGQWFVMILLTVCAEKSNTSSLLHCYYVWKRKTCLDHSIEPKSASECKGETKAIFLVRTSKNPLRDRILNILPNPFDDFTPKIFEFHAGPLDLYHSVQKLSISSI